MEIETEVLLGRMHPSRLLATTESAQTSTNDEARSVWPSIAMALSPDVRRRLTLMKISAAIIFSMAAVMALAIFARRRGTALATSRGADVVIAQRENFVRVLRLTGTTEAIRSRPILAPRLSGAQIDSMVITELVPAGSRVRKGEVLVRFDPQAQIKDLLDKKGAYEDLLDQIAEKKAAEDAARAKDDTELKQAQDDLTKARLEVSKNDILSRIDAEKNVENLQEAQATLKQLQQTYRLKRQAAAANIETLRIQAGRAQATMLYAQGNEARMTIRSPMDGVVVLNTIWLSGRMGQVQEGDQVRPGVPFMNVVDPSRMEVMVNVNQEDLLALHLGQRARIHLDAYPSLSFSGRLDELTPLGHSNEFSNMVRTFTALFSIDGTNTDLMPDLSAAVDVEMDQQKDALAVPIRSILDEGGHSYVWLSTATGFEKRAVSVTAENDAVAIIGSGLNAGQAVLSNAAAHGAP